MYDKTRKDRMRSNSMHSEEHLWIVALIGDKFEETPLR